MFHEEKLDAEWVKQNHQIRAYRAKIEEDDYYEDIAQRSIAGDDKHDPDSDNINFEGEIIFFNEFEEKPTDL
jgi:hypothetical protein